MAFKTVVGNNVVTWATHECEDYLVVDAYLSVLDSVASKDIRLKEFELNWLQKGRMLLRAHLAYFNEILSSGGGRKLRLEHNNQSTYSSVNGEVKSRERIRILEELRGIDAQSRTALIHSKVQEAAQFQPVRENGAPAQLPITLAANEHVEDRSDIKDIKIALLNALSEITQLNERVRELEEDMDEVFDELFKGDDQ